jgi:hypothetical protein
VEPSDDGLEREADLRSPIPIRAWNVQKSTPLRDQTETAAALASPPISSTHPPNTTKHCIAGSAKLQSDRLLAHQRSRFTHYYFYIRDEVLGPIVMRVASFFPFQTCYYLNATVSSSKS